jgi:hypothetical protein
MAGSRTVDTELEPEPMRPTRGDDCDSCPGRLDRLLRVGRIVAGLVSFAASAWWTARAIASWWRSTPDVGPGVELWPRDPATLPDSSTFAGILHVDPLTVDELAAADQVAATLDSAIRL